MALTTREMAVLGILLCCVPFQLWLSKLSALTPEEKGMRLQTMLVEQKLRIQSWFSPSLWVVWMKDIHRSLFKKDIRWYPDDTDPLGECPAVEVLRARFPMSYFGTSVEPRKSRSGGVKWRIGQVIKHKTYGYSGVIIGWDRTCKAPDFWIKQMHGSNIHWRFQPNYAVLVDSRDRPDIQTTYVVEENIEVVKEKIQHPSIPDYFDYYDGAQYIPQPWLRALYPLD